MANVLVADDAYLNSNSELLSIGGRQSLPVRVIDSGSLIAPWASVLVAGATSGGTSPVLSVGDSLHIDGAGILQNNGGFLFLQSTVPAAGVILRPSGGAPFSLVMSDISFSVKGKFGTNAIVVTDGGLAFWGGVTTQSPSITGSRGGNAALASLLSALDSMGLITDNTT